MNLFDIIGPVMVGPSSSHTAGAARIGYIARLLLNEKVQKAEIYLHGSFLATGKGHGTDRALIAGLLGMKPEDERIPDSFQIAENQGLEYSFRGIELRDAHPNSVLLKLTGVKGRQLEVEAASVGGGRIKVSKLDGVEADFCGDYPTLIVCHQDITGHVAEVTSILAQQSINIATMQLHRSKRGGEAVLILECDQEVPEVSLKWLEQLEGIRKVTYLSLTENKESAI